MMIQTKSGLLTGIEEEYCIHYHGIPYAQPPVGALRWKAPQPCAPWEGVYEAVKDPFRAPQEPRTGSSEQEFGNSPVPCTEDCLYLNIRTPKGTPEKPWPVAVWIHGGAFNHGWCFEKEYDTQEYAKAGVILVTINYRLDALGFLAHPLLTAESGTSGNYGILDQIAALRWVQENIAAFGGDPGNVTVFGQSAGAMSTLVLLGSPLAKGLFHKAIMQSGVGLEQDLPLADAEQNGLDFARVTGANTLDELRALTVEQLMQGTRDVLAERRFSGGRLLYAPVLDGCVIPDTYANCRNQLPDVPVMLGSTMDDLGGNWLADATKAFCAQRAAMQQSPLYAYYFTRRLPGNDAGAFHSADLWYMFGSFHNCWRPMTDADRELSARMAKAWTDFMKTDTPGWDAFTEEKPYVQTLDVK